MWRWDASLQGCAEALNLLIHLLRWEDNGFPWEELSWGCEELLWMCWNLPQLNSQEFFPWLTQGQDPWHAWHTMTTTLRQTEVRGKGQKRSYRWNYEKIISKKWKWVPWHYFQLTWNSVDLRIEYTRRTQDRQKRTFLLFSKYYSFHNVRTCVWGGKQGRKYRTLEFSPKLPTYTMVHFIRLALYCAWSGSRPKGHQCNFHFYSLKNKFPFTREFSIR